jgi:hypothetical protein
VAIRVIRPRSAGAARKLESLDADLHRFIFALHPTGRRLPTRRGRYRLPQQARFAILHQVNVWNVQPLDLRGPIREERGELLALVGGLTPDEWLMPTACAGRRVKEVALHLLGSDLSWLSRGRDGDLNVRIPMNGDYRGFVAALNQKNQRWIDASQGLSRRLVQDLLAWSGEQVAA